MDEANLSPRRTSRARERIAARKRRHAQKMATPQPRPVRAIPQDELEAMHQVPQPGYTERLTQRLPRVQLDGVGRFIGEIRDFVWHLVNRSPFLKLLPLVIVAVLAIMVFVNSFTGQIGPNVWALNTNLGGASLEEAQARLESAWAENIQILVRLDDETVETVRPAEIGLTLDAAAVVARAQEVGFAGFPFGVEVEPVLSLDEATAQTYLLTLVDPVYVPPYEAGFAWEGDQLVGVPGSPSRELDVLTTLSQLKQNPLRILERGALDLITTATPPNTADPTPYIDAAYQFLTRGFTLTGYDPFVDQIQQWTTSQEQMTRWLAAGPTGLRLREDIFRDFILAINGQLDEGEDPRYLMMDETMQTVQTAVLNNEPEAMVRIRYLPTEYAVRYGDRGFGIARAHGMPFQLIEQANPDRDLNIINDGDVITIPSRDLVMPQQVITDKRIVVDLERRWLVAYENGEVIYNWEISVGLPGAPTSPGIFQVLSKVDIATGSSADLCNQDSGVCGQWRMEYFMGIYEVATNLTNGFHGTVYLPNGGILGDGAIGRANTYGCVMSSPEQARLLYEWAEIGTVVEVVSADFPPQSELGAQAITFINQVRGA